MSFAREMEEVTVESGESESSDESNTPDYVESLIPRETSGHLVTKSMLSFSSRCLKVLIWAVCHQSQD